MSAQSIQKTVGLQTVQSSQEVGLQADVVATEDVGLQVEQSQKETASIGLQFDYLIPSGVPSIGKS